MNRRVSPFRLTVVGWAVGVMVSAIILGTPYLVFGYHNPRLHLVLDTFDAFVALLVGFLVYGRLQRSRKLQDLLLLQSLVLLGLAGLGTLLIAVLESHRPGTLDVWIPLVLRVAAALLLIASAATGIGYRAHTDWRMRHLLAPSGVVGASVLALWIFNESLPIAFDPSQPPPSPETPIIFGHPLLLTGQGLAAGCFALASIGFAVQASRRGDELLRWLGPACALGAFARLNYMLFPSLYSDWLYTGDLLRTGCYLLLLIGAAREIRDYWRAREASAILEDRRRLARELHDGVIQELTFIRGATLTTATASAYTRSVLEASERALDEARAAVHALSIAGNEPLGSLLHRAASQVTDRSRTALELEIDGSVTAPAQHQHTLMRITREAVSNAVRHGNGSRVCVRLHQDDAGRHLVIQDDGQGFDVPSTLASRSGYGLISMHDRAAGMHGTLHVEASPDRGSTVRLTW